MNYGEIIKCDTANGTGIRLSLFVSGCTHCCRGCFQPQTWNFGYGKPFTEKTMKDILDELEKPYYNGLTVLGGEPLHPRNRETVARIISLVKENLPGKDIWIYTGYVLEDLIRMMHKDADYQNSPLYRILKNTDILVDGPFVEELKDISLCFKGSSNQRIINMHDVSLSGPDVTFVGDFSVS